jgi:hypothetical protein
MKTCEACRQENPPDAKFCRQCGNTFAVVESSAESSAPPSEDALWRTLIGPHAGRYLETFKKFSGPNGPRFALTWHWPGFLFEPFLWFLYRKMYMYALVYAVGPVVAFYFTQDLTADLVWRVMAGVSANYIYYWHIKEQLATIRIQRTLDPAARDRMLSDAGGVQPYVVWVGVGLFALKVALLITILQDSPPDSGQPVPQQTKPAPGGAV